MGNKCDDKDREAVLQNRIIYSLPVRQGFWNDELAFDEEKKTILAYKRDRGQLLAQKTRRMFDNLLKPCSVASSYQYVTYGQNYQIKCADIEEALNPNDKTDTNLYLSGLLTEQEIDEHQNLTHGCLITASNCREACARNTFQIVAANGDQNGEPVLYGDDVFLKITSEQSFPLYVQCENSTTQCMGDHLAVKLSQIPNIYCRFKFLFWNPQKRYETAGMNFSPNERVIIQHTATGTNLVIEPTCFPTFFGTERTVSCHIYKDAHKMETAENFWTIITDK